MSAYADIISIGIKLILTIISAICTAVVIPWLKETVIPWLRERHYYEVVSSLVKAAEKLGETGAIDKSTKKGWVLRMLARKGYEVDEGMAAMIEAAVKDLDDTMAAVVTATTELFNDADDAEHEHEVVDGE